MVVNSDVDIYVVLCGGIVEYLTTETKWTSGGLWPENRYAFTCCFEERKSDTRAIDILKNRGLISYLRARVFLLFRLSLLTRFFLLYIQSISVNSQAEYPESSRRTI